MLGKAVPLLLDRLTDAVGSGRDIARAMMRALKIGSVKEMEKEGRNT